MPRSLIPDSPLKGAAPVLRPTVRPEDTPVTMRRAAPQGVGLMELGDAFRDFVPELRTLIRDVAAREDGDARAKGEQEAENLYREGRLNEINATLKAKADSGEIPRHLVPSYYQGASYRYGIHAADALNAELLKTVNEAAVKGNTDEHIQAALQAAASKVNPDDLYARAGFDQASREVVSSYRSRVAHQATVNFEQQAEYEAAQAGYRHVTELATAPAANVGAVLERMKSGLDLRRGQVSPAVVNGEFMKNSVKPAIADLFAQKRFEEAHQLISRLRTFDVTGQGGMFGKIADVSYELDVLEQQAINQGEQHADTINQQFKRDLETAQLSANKFITDTLEGAKANGQSFLPSDIDAAVSAWAKNLPASADKNAYTRAAREGFAKELSDETAAKRMLNAPAIGAFYSKMTSLKPEDIDRYAAYAAAIEAAGTASPDMLAEMRNRISSLQARSGIVNEQHVSMALKNVFPLVPSLSPGTPARITARFPDNSKEAEDAWSSLGDDGRGRIQLEVNNWIVDQLRERTGAISDMRMADAEMQKILPQVISDAQKHAAHVAVRVAKDGQKRSFVAKSVETARRIKFLDNSRWSPASVDIRFATTAKDTSGNVLDVTKRVYDVPKADVKALTEAAGGPAKYFSVPTAERDAALVSTARGFWSAGQGPVWTDLVSVAKDINQTDDPDKAAKAYEVYGNAKSQLGFTPEEVQAGVTKHGVAFVAKEIDPRYITVFRSVVELEAAYNGGKPTPLFNAMKTAVAEPDPANPMSAADFYTAQLVRLKHIQ